MVLDLTSNILITIILLMPKCIAANSTFKCGVRHFGHPKASNKPRLKSRGVSKGFVIIISVVFSSRKNKWVGAPPLYFVRIPVENRTVRIIVSVVIVLALAFLAYIWIGFFFR